jgi:vacuolar-type H+-ATPase subunit E/Vma4
MGINHLTADILAEARKEAKAITDAAEAESRKALEEEKREVKKMLSKAEKEADDFVAAQQRERIAWAKLEAKKMVGEAKEYIVTDAMDSFYKRLADFRKSGQYGKFLNERVKAATIEIVTKTHIARICKGDKKLLKGFKGTIREDLNRMGGAIVLSPDETVQVDCTLEGLFEEKREFLRKKLYERMFR